MSAHAPCQIQALAQVLQALASAAAAPRPVPGGSRARARQAIERGAAHALKLIQRNGRNQLPRAQWLMNAVPGLAGWQSSRRWVGCWTSRSMIRRMGANGLERPKYGIAHVRSLPVAVSGPVHGRPVSVQGLPA